MRWWPHRSAEPADPRAQARRRLGRESEQLARRLLAEAGYVVEQANVRVPVGEIDLVARDGNTLCFVEVRSTSSEAWGGALASITRSKQRRLIRAARWYLQRLPQAPAAVRFDVVAVAWAAAGPPRTELVRDAFAADGLDW